MLILLAKVARIGQGDECWKGGRLSAQGYLAWECVGVKKVVFGPGTRHGQTCKLMAKERGLGLADWVVCPGMEAELDAGLVSWAGKVLGEAQ